MPGATNHTGLTQVQRVGLLAARAQGVSNAEVQEHLQVATGNAAAVLVTAERRLQMTKVRCKGLLDGRACLRWFLTADDARQWLERERARLEAALRAHHRLTAAQAAEQASAVVSQAVVLAPKRPAPVARVELTIKRRPERAAKAGGPEEVPWADRPAITTDATKVTVYARTPEPHRVDLMADPLPGVPGWRTGPCLREGATDYRRHQAAATLAAGVQP